ACWSATDEDVVNGKVSWTTILPEVKLQADFEHLYEAEMAAHPVVSHVRLNIFPDGGVSRLRLFGHKKSIQ
ncbi:MAG TPA: hypothetical protein PKK69_06310, partial [Ferruginibacter sp.]|nr:hypothetical protein [Ferruginibacter sp.]